MNKKEAPIVIHTSKVKIIDDFYKDKNKKNDIGIAKGLYLELYYSVRLQSTNRVWANINFLSKKLGVGKDRVIRIRKDLVSMGLIKYIESTTKGLKNKSYIEVNHIWRNETTEKLFYQETTEMTMYKIARNLLLNNFNEYEAIEPNFEYSFDEVEMNNASVDLIVEHFYFADSILIAKCYLSINEEEYHYTIPTNQAMEIVMKLADSYKYSFKGIVNALQSNINVN